MSTVTDSDIKEIKDLIIVINDNIKTIDNRITSLDNRMTNLDNRVTNIDNKMTNLDNRMTKLENEWQDFQKNQIEIKAKMSIIELSTQKIPDMAERVGELKNWKQIGLALFGTLVGGLITYLIKTPNL
ncbi:MAG: hypothetical protein QNJ33_10015 [Crocosphaera sp.]|nr:hypothetical protein [Crocosphaera sp.]